MGGVGGEEGEGIRTVLRQLLMIFVECFVLLKYGGCMRVVEACGGDEGFLSLLSSPRGAGFQPVRACILHLPGASTPFFCVIALGILVVLPELMARCFWGGL